MKLKIIAFFAWPNKVSEDFCGLDDVFGPDPPWFLWPILAMIIIILLLPVEWWLV